MKKNRITSNKLFIYSFLLLLTNIFCFEVKAQLVGGAIGVQPTFGSLNTNNVFCSGKLLQITSPYCDLLNGTPPYTYLWQFDSSGVWYDIPSSNNCTYNAIVRFGRTRYRRKVTDATNATAFSNIVPSYTCTFYQGSAYACSPQLNIAVGYQPPVLSNIGGTPEVVEDPYGTVVASSQTNFDWFKSITSPNSGFSSVGGYALSYNPPMSNTVQKVYYRRAVSSQFCYCITDSTNYNTWFTSFTNPAIINYIASNPFNAGSVIPNNTAAIIGSTINFNASTLPSGGSSANYYYQWQDSIPNSSGWNDIAGATSSTYQTVLNQHKYFRRSALNNCDMSFSTNQYMRSISSIGAFVNSNVNAFTASAVSGNYWYDISDAAGNVIASINPGSNNLGTVSISMKHFGTNATDIPVSNNNITYMPRYFEISSSAYPTGVLPAPVSVRLFYKTSDFTNYKTKIGNSALVLNDLRIMHYHGANQDCDFNNNTTLGGTTQLTPTNTTFADGFYLTSSVSSFSEFGVVAKSFIVPVIWKNFSGEIKEKFIQLKWTLSNQVNNKGFDIQRSANGIQYESLGFVDASNSLLNSNYFFYDNAPLNGANVYRIRQVDKDGSSSFSNSITLRLNNKNNFAVYPNPVKDFVTIQSATADNSKYIIFDLFGKKVLSGTVNNNQKIDLQTIANGVYSLQLSTGNFEQIFKLIKQ